MATKGSAKKSSAKKSASKKSTLKVTSGKTGAKRVRAPGSANARRQTVKVEEDRAQYNAKIEANESRLRSSTGADGQPLTPQQITITQDILKRQREHLAELDAYERAKQDGDPRQPSSL